MYKSNQNVSVDEASCKWKGRSAWKCYNLRKPARFHIKLYQVCEAVSGCVIAYEVYVGKAKSKCIKMSQPLDKKVTNTTKLVLGHLRKGELLDKGYCVYMDNYYTSPELLSECFYRNTYGAGTVQSNRWGLPKGVIEAKLEKGETCFH